MRRLILGTAMALASGFAAAQGGADVGLVNLVSGEVSYAPLTGSPSKVQAYMRVRDGDRFTIPPQAQLRVVFFDGGRQERWQGPASFRAAKGGSEAISGKPTEVAILPSGVPQRIARVPELMQNAKLGGIQVRGGLTRTQQASLDQQETLREARATYKKLRAETPAEDITPELYLYSVLYDFLLYDEMKTVVDDMLRRQPGNEDVKNLAAWVASRARK